MNHLIQVSKGIRDLPKQRNRENPLEQSNPGACVLGLWQTTYRWREFKVGSCRELGNSWTSSKSMGADEVVVVKIAMETWKERRA